MKRYLYIDKNGRLLYYNDGLIMRVVGCGTKGFELRFKK